MTYAGYLFWVLFIRTLSFCAFLLLLFCVCFVLVCVVVCFFFNQIHVIAPLITPKATGQLQLNLEEFQNQMKFLQGCGEEAVT